MKSAGASHGARRWNHVALELESGGHYLDPFLGTLKRREYLTLIEAWSPGDVDGPTLKTDLFEEAMGRDALLDALSSGGIPAVGVELSAAIAVRAARRCAGRGLIVVGDVRALPFRDGVFGRIVSPSTLDHFEDPADLGASLRELGRTMRPDASLIVTLDNRSNVFDPLLRLAKRLGLVPYPLERSYTVRELRRELASAGFEVVDTTAILHNPRLMAVGAVTVARRLRWGPLERLVENVLLKAQHLGRTRLRFLTGSFVAALARKVSRVTPFAR